MVIAAVTAAAAFVNFGVIQQTNKKANNYTNEQTTYV